MRLALQTLAQIHWYQWQDSHGINGKYQFLEINTFFLCRIILETNEHFVDIQERFWSCFNLAAILSVWCYCIKKITFLLLCSIPQMGTVSRGTMVTIFGAGLISHFITWSSCSWSFVAPCHSSGSFIMCFRTGVFSLTSPCKDPLQKYNSW